MNARIPRTLATLVLLAPFSLGLGCPPAPNCPTRLDDPESAQEQATGLDACARAAKTLHDLHCPEDRPDFADFCRHMLGEGIPLCPTKLSHIKSCAEIKDICR